MTATRMFVFARAPSLFPCAFLDRVTHVRLLLHFVWFFSMQSPAGMAYTTKNVLAILGGMVLGFAGRRRYTYTLSLTHTHTHTHTFFSAALVCVCVFVW